ncbi:MAG: hypothetical protein WB611_01375 [Stellaceae bacterium]
MRKRILILMLMLASLWPAAAFCAITVANIAPAVMPIRAALRDIDVTIAPPGLDINPVPLAVAPVLVRWRNALSTALDRTALFDGNGPPLSLHVLVMELARSGQNVTVFARYQLWRPGAEQPLTDADILTDAGPASPLGLGLEASSSQVMQDRWQVDQAVSANIADFVRQLEVYAAQTAVSPTAAYRATRGPKSG